MIEVNLRVRESKLTPLIIKVSDIDLDFASTMVGKCFLQNNILCYRTYKNGMRKQKILAKKFYKNANPTTGESPHRIDHINGDNRDFQRINLIDHEYYSPKKPVSEFDNGACFLAGAAANVEKRAGWGV